MLPFASLSDAAATTKTLQLVVALANATITGLFMFWFSKTCNNFLLLITKSKPVTFHFKNEKQLTGLTVFVRRRIS